MGIVACSSLQIKMFHAYNTILLRSWNTESNLGDIGNVSPASAAFLDYVNSIDTLDSFYSLK
jgi:hypothetical protein